MRALFTISLYTLVFLYLTQYFVKCDQKNSDEPIQRESEIDRDVPAYTERGHTTLCYEDIPPLSIEVDGAPACAPVVYGSEHDLNSEDKMIKTDQEVKRLREEFFEKHRTDAPGSAKNEALKKSGALKTGKIELNENVDEINGLNELDLQKKDSIIKQHWNAEQVNKDFIRSKEGNKQHWNREPIEKQNNKGKVFTVIPGVDSEPGYKNDQLQRDIHEEIYADPSMKEINKHKIIAEKKMDIKVRPQNEVHQNVHKANSIQNKLKSLLDLKNNPVKEKGFKNFKKMMAVELRQTTNEHQKDTFYGPACGKKKISKNNENNVLKEHKKTIKLKRRKRNIKSTKRPKSKKTTQYFMDIDGRFRDIDEVERERNEFASWEAKQTPPSWIHDDGYRPKTERKFRPRPTLGYNRCPKEPLDYGSYDKSEHWRMMTELIHSGTLPAKFYESLSMPTIPDTKEIFSACRENFTTSECFRYPDISRLRDTREKKFMKKYYHKEYPEFESTE